MKTTLSRPRIVEIDIDGDIVRTYPRKGYWYHVSDTLRKDEITLHPRVEGVNRCFEEPEVPRVCVAPSIEQCMTALPYCLGIMSVYRTKYQVNAVKAINIEDAHITEEHWIIRPIKFVKIGILDLGEFDPPVECASNCLDFKLVRKTLGQWRRRKLVERFLTQW